MHHPQQAQITAEFLVEGAGPRPRSAAPATTTPTNWPQPQAS